MTNVQPSKLSILLGQLLASVNDARRGALARLLDEAQELSSALQALECAFARSDAMGVVPARSCHVASLVGGTVFEAIDVAYFARSALRTPIGKLALPDLPTIEAIRAELALVIYRHLASYMMVAYDCHWEEESDIDDDTFAHALLDGVEVALGAASAYKWAVRDAYHGSSAHRCTLPTLKRLERQVAGQLGSALYEAFSHAAAQYADGLNLEAVVAQYHDKMVALAGTMAQQRVGMANWLATDPASLDHTGDH